MASYPAHTHTHNEWSVPRTFRGLIRIFVLDSRNNKGYVNDKWTNRAQTYGTIAQMKVKFIAQKYCRLYTPLSTKALTSAAARRVANISVVLEHSPPDELTIKEEWRNPLTGWSHL